MNSIGLNFLFQYSVQNKFPLKLYFSKRLKLINTLKSSQKGFEVLFFHHQVQKFLIVAKYQRLIYKRNNMKSFNVF